VYRKSAGQFLRFACVGILNTAIDFGVFMLLYKIVSVHYAFCQISGCLVGILNSFAWNKYWTFEKTQNHQNVVSQFGIFFIVNGFSLVLSLVGLAILIDVLALPVTIAKIVILFFSQFINFIGYKLLVFKQ